MNSAEKLRLLRQRMQEQGMDAYVVVTDDFHGSEYVGDYFKAREYLSGFTGSAGTLVVLPDSAALWTDGRYFLQAADQLAGSTIDLMRAGQPGVPTIGAFLAQRVPQGGTVGFDGRTVSSLFARTMAAALEGKNVRFAYEQDLAGAVWPDRPALSAQPVWELPAECAGLTREEKLHLLREKMRETGAEVLVLTALDEVAWTLNLRGDDVRCTPVFLSFLLLRQEEATLCVQEQILSGELKEKLAAYGIETIFITYSGDGVDNVAGAISEARNTGADMILCTGGMSVDPDDNTPGGIKQSGARIVTYGAPVLPGAMFLLGYFEDGTPIMGLPGCVMYAGATIFDLALPRIAAGVELTRRDFAVMGEGGLCLGCKPCHWPNCPFGK